jgi:hypothetical protein
MSDYVRSSSTFFTDKDALDTGHVDKVVRGSEIDAELNEVATAVATKYDSADLASASVAKAGASNTVLMTPLRVVELLQEGSGTLAPVVDALTLDGTAATFTQRASLASTHVTRNIRDANASLALRWRESADTSANYIFARATGSFGSETVTTVFSIVNSTGVLNFAVMPTVASNTLFTTANDGTGSGLDADLVDGQHASAFAAASHVHAGEDITSGTVADARLSSNVPLKNGANTMSGVNSFTNTLTNITDRQDSPATRILGYRTAVPIATSTRSIDETDEYAILRNSTSSNHTLTVANDSDIPAGSMFILSRISSGEVNITQGTGVTLNWLNGSGTVSTGSRVLATGGVCTLYKVSDTVWDIWGTGVS